MNERMQALNEEYLDRYCGELPITEDLLAEDALRVAEALDAGDPQGAQHGIACLTCYDPFHPEWRALLERTLEVAGKLGSQELFVDGLEPGLPFLMVRAYRDAWLGKHEQALDAAVEVVSHSPNTLCIEAWALSWLEDPAVLKAVGGEAVARTLGAMIHNRYPEHDDMPDDLRGYLEHALRVTEAVREHLGDAAIPHQLASILLGKLGRFEEAIAFSRQSYDADPCWRTAVALGMAMRRAKDVDGAIGMMRKAAEHDPEDKTAWLDIGDMYLDTDRFAEALQAYEEVLAKNEEDQWARPSAAFCRYKLTGEDQHLETLRDLGHEHSEDCTCGTRDALSGLFAMMGYDPEKGTRRAQALLALLD